MVSWIRRDTSMMSSRDLGVRVNVISEGGVIISPCGA
jgi:hypothetical protein